MLTWQIDARGCTGGGVDGREAYARRARLWSGAGRGRGGDRRATASTGGVASASATSALHANGPDVAGLVGQVAPAGTGGGLPGPTVDAAALASRVGGSPLDLPA